MTQRSSGVSLQDLICNVIGNRWWVKDLEWEGAAAWNAAPEEPWSVDGEAAGTAQVAEPLSFVKVANAGHMVRTPHFAADFAETAYSQVSLLVS